MGRKLFCEINDTCYKISQKKEAFKRTLKDIKSKERFAKTYLDYDLPFIVKSHRSLMLRSLPGVDMKLQENKITNLMIACKKVNRIVIKDKEVFSFWNTVGNPSKKKGYKEGLIISKRKLTKGVAGGLCALANMIHYLVLNSPLDVVELHHHSDALFPDNHRNVPFGTGTSICYKNADYRFKNNTGSPVQILVWCDGKDLCGELRSTSKFPYRYKLKEEDNHYKMENDKYYRNSKVYRLTIDRETNKEIKKELILNNHSEVLYDYSLINKDEIRK